jgi:predicted membrane-bound mannosyltransferase
MRFLEWYLIGFAAFLLLTLARFFFRAGGLNTQPIGIAVLAGLIVTVLVQAGSALGQALMARRIRADPSLEAALNNELVQSLESHSWRAAFLGAAAATVFFAVVSFFYPVCDPVMIALTAIVTGFGAYQGTFYFKYRSL